MYSDLLPLHLACCLPMPTAIARIYTTEGFVVAADGRESLDEDRKRADDAQKIFPIKRPHINVAYSIAGAVEMASLDGRPPLNLIAQIENAWRALDQEPPDRFGDYIALLFAQVYKPLAQSRYNYPEKDKRHGVLGPPIYEIARIFLDGYYRGFAASGEAALYHFDKRMLEPESYSPPDVRVTRELDYAGSHVVFHYLFRTDDPRFAKYRRPAPPPGEVTLAEAVLRARGYIEACSDEVVRQIDPEAYKTIGGKTHIAKVTRDGFEWEPGFEPGRFWNPPGD